MEKYIDATQEAGKLFYQNFHDKGKIVMLNMLKFKAQADYTHLGNIAPKQAISGKEAYQLYMDHVRPLLDKAGSRVLFYGASSNYLIGPSQEKWDAVLLVEHASVAEFMAFAQNEDYLKHIGHRTAALEDARLLPITEMQQEAKV